MQVSLFVGVVLGILWASFISDRTPKNWWLIFGVFLSAWLFASWMMELYYR